MIENIYIIYISITFVINTYTFIVIISVYSYCSYCNSMSVCVANSSPYRMLHSSQIQTFRVHSLADPYVKIWLMHDGKKQVKQKTETIDKNLDPVFNQSFEFSVPYERVRQVYVGVRPRRACGALNGIG